MKQPAENTPVLDASGFLERPYPSKGIWNYLINLASIILLSLGIYFLPGVAIAKATPVYQESEATMKRIEAAHGLTLNKQEASADELQEAVRHFYLVDYPDQIKANYNSQGLYEGYTIEHIFNIVAYDLPANPTADNYKSNYFYYEYAEGHYLVDQEASRRTDLGGLARNFGYRNKFVALYERLFNLLRTLDEEYYAADRTLNSTLSFTRFFSMLFVVAVFELALPLIFGKGRSLGELISKTCHAQKYGFAYRWWKTLLRFSINAPLLLLYFFFLSFYSTIIALIIPALVDLLIMILSQSHQFFYERFSFTVLIEPEKSEVFESKEEYAAFLKEQENNFEDPEFANLLSKIDPVAKKEE